MHTFSGELRISASGTVLSSTVDGTSSAFAGFAMTILTNGTPGGSADLLDSGGQSGLGGVTAAPDFIVHPATAYYGTAILSITFSDSDSVAFDGSRRDPANNLIPPDYAPDISLFEVHGFSVYQELCTDIFRVSEESLCSAGGGSHQWLDVFDVTVDRFLDPVPEPGWLALIALTLTAPICVRMGGLWRRRNVSSG